MLVPRMGHSEAHCFFSFTLRDRGREGEREEKKHLLVASRMCHDWGRNLQPRHVL